MPSGQLVASSLNEGTAAAERINDSRRIFVASNGQRVAILEDASGNLKYSTSSDGVTWSAATALYTGASANVYGTLAYISDVLHVFFVNGGANITHLQFTYTTGSNSFGAATTNTTVASYSAINKSLVAAAWDTTNSVWFIAWAAPSGSNSLFVCVLNNAGTLVTGSTTAYTASAVIPAIYGITVVPGTTSTIKVLFRTPVPSLMYWQTTWAPSSYVAASPAETIYSGTATFAACALDNSNLLDIVYVTSGAAYATKRTGTGTYSTAASIAGSINSSYPYVSLVPDGTGGLFVFYSSTANQTTGGEIYLVQRQSSAWQPAALFAGGDAGGYELPHASSPMASSTTHVTYQTGTSTFAVYYKTFSLGSTPSTPVNLAPIGNIGTTTPAHSFQYGNPSAGDAQLAYEIKVVRVSDSFVMWDSGKVTSALTSGITYGTGSNTGDINYVAPTALSNGIAYTWQARTWDTVLNSVSAYSAASTFTPYHAPTAAITNILSNAVNSTSSPATIGSPTMDITFSYTQTDGNAANAYQTTVFQADGVTVLWAGTAQTLSPTLASGGTFTTPDVTPVGMNNSSTYMLQVAVTDSVTGNVAKSPLWTLLTNWAPPSAPTGLTATPNTGLGFMALAWTNGGSTATTNVYRRPTGTTAWTTLSSGTLRSNLDDFCALGTAFDYGVQGVGATGATTSIVVVSSVTLGQAFGKYGFWLNSVTDPLGTQVPLGLLPSSGGSGGNDYQAATEWDHNELVASFVPNGRKKPIFDAGIVAFDNATGRGFIVLDTDTSGGITLTSTGIVNTLIAIDDAHQAVQWRDPYGDVRFVYITNVKRWRYSRVAMWAQFDISDVDFQGGQVIV